MRRSRSLARHGLLGAVAIAATAGLLPGVATAASAAPAVWGTGVFLTSRNCNGVAAAVDCLGPANPNIRIRESIYGGGASTAANVSLAPVTGGSSRSRVTFGALDLPVIKAGAFAGADNRNNSNSVGYQQFTYTGAAGTPFGLTASFDYTSSGAPSLAGLGADDRAPEIGGEGSGFLRIGLIDPSAVTGLVTAQDVFNFGFGGACGDPGVFGFAGMRLFSSAAGLSSGSLTLATGCDGNPLFLTPGQSFVVSMLLQTPSNRGGYFDATHTVRLGLDPTLSDAVKQALANSLNSAIPEPASWAMMVAGFGLAGAVMRRRRVLAAA